MLYYFRAKFLRRRLAYSRCLYERSDNAAIVVGLGMPLDPEKEARLRMLDGDG